MRAAKKAQAKAKRAAKEMAKKDAKKLKRKQVKEHKAKRSENIDRLTHLSHAMVSQAASADDDDDDDDEQRRAAYRKKVAQASNFQAEIDIVTKYGHDHEKLEEIKRKEEQEELMEERRAAKKAAEKKQKRHVSIEDIQHAVRLNKVNEVKDMKTHAERQMKSAMHAANKAT